MSIDLLETMEWSKLSWDESTQGVVDLDVVLPKVGNVYPVNLDGEESRVGERIVNILWKPPHSELNGWYDKRPSEILKSYVIKGKLEFSANNGNQYKFEVEDRVKLIEMIERCEETNFSPFTYVGQISGDSKLQWLDASMLEIYRFGKYVYLTGIDGESTLEAILSNESGRICVHFSSTFQYPEYYSTSVTNYYLSSSENKAFEKLIPLADEIDDESYLMLQDNQVFGAEYF